MSPQKKNKDTKWLTDNSVSLHQSNGECMTPNAVSAKHRLQTEDEGQTEGTMQTENYVSMQTRFKNNPFPWKYFKSELGLRPHMVMTIDVSHFTGFGGDILF